MKPKLRLFALAALLISFTCDQEVKSEDDIDSSKPGSFGRWKSGHDSPRHKKRPESTNSSAVPQAWNLIKSIHDEHQGSELAQELFLSRRDPVGVPYDSTNQKSVNRESGHLKADLISNEVRDSIKVDSMDSEDSQIDPDSEFALMMIEGSENSNQASETLRQFKDKLDHLTAEQRERVTELDMLDANDADAGRSCFLCSLAGNRGLTVTQFAREHNLNLSVYNNNGSFAQIMRLLASTENLKARGPKTFEGVNPRKDLVEFLSQKIPRGHEEEFVLGYWREDLGKMGRMVKAKAWKSHGSDGLELLLTDFQLPPDHPQRFSTELDPKAETIVIIDPKNIEFRFKWNEGPINPLPKIQFGNSSAKLVRQNLIDQRANLPREFRSHMRPIDLSDVAAGTELPNCFLCLPAVLSGGLTVPQLLSANGVSMSSLVGDGKQAMTVERIVDIYRHLGFPYTKIVHSGDLNSIKEYLSDNIGPGAEIAVPVAYERIGGTIQVVLLKVWRHEESQELRFLVVDFCYPADNTQRFKRSLKLNHRDKTKPFHIISPLKLKLVTEERLNQDMKVLDFNLTPEGKCARRIIGYVPSSSQAPFEAGHAIHYTNLIYSFVRMDESGNLHPPNDTLSAQRILELFTARKVMRSKGLELLISFSIGGWSGSQHMSDVLSDQSKRSNLVRNIADFVDGYHFDGVDIDWEYPVTGGASTGKLEDRANYVALVEELRSALKPKKLISIAAGAGVDAMDSFDVRELIKHVDWIGVMGYDYFGAWDSEMGAYVGPNSPLYNGAPVGYSDRLNAEWAIKQYVCNSGDPSKIVLGVPFYGRYWTKTREGPEPRKHPLFRVAERVDGKFGGDKSFRSLQSTWLRPQSGFKIFWDESTRTPWALQQSTGLTVSFDNAESIRQKVAFVRDYQLGGVMVWSVEQDDAELELTNNLGGVCGPTNSAEKSIECGWLKQETRGWSDADKSSNAEAASFVHRNNSMRE